MEVKWSKFKGIIKRPACEASIEMMDLYEPQWFCRFYRVCDEAMELAVGTFEEGQLDGAYNWCEKKITEYEEQHTGRAGN